jgi:hypothetical protein
MSALEETIETNYDRYSSINSDSVQTLYAEKFAAANGYEVIATVHSLPV